MSLLSKLTETIEHREDNYDSPLPNFLRIAMLWSIWYNQIFTPLDVIFMMDLMKTAREIHNHSDDTLLDKTGYTISCYERCDDAMKKLGYSGIEYFRRFNNNDVPSFWLSELYRILGEWKAYESANLQEQSN